MINYDQTFEPPAPLLNIVIFAPTDTHVRANTQALLDTGAEISVIPDVVVRQLALTPYAVMLVEAYDSRTRQLPLYAVTLEIAGTHLSTVKMVAYPVNYAILGRDILNRFVVTLDGPRLVFDISTST